MNRRGWTSRAAGRASVKIRKLYSLRCESVQIGCANLTAVGTDIRITEIIGKNDDDIGLG